MEYYILINEKPEGPFALERLNEMHITPQTLAWHQGMPSWLPAGQIDELQFLWNTSTPPPVPPIDTTPATPTTAPKTWLVESILVTVLCCLPFGIVGIVYASRVSSLLKSENYAEAVEASKNAGKWTKIGFIVGLVATLLYIAFLAVYTFMASSF